MILVATQSSVLALNPDTGTVEAAYEPEGGRPTCLVADPRTPGRAWCGTDGAGVLRTDDAGGDWRPVGLEGERLMSLAASPSRTGLLWAGTEPSAVWRSVAAGGSWERTRHLGDLPSAREWAFPPRPETHHVRWIACHPADADRLWVAIEAGALISTTDGGRTWRDRVRGGPYDTHEVAVHPEAPDFLRVAAGDGYFESRDGGSTWSRPRDGLEVGYLRSVAVDPGDPEVAIVSASSRARTAYVAGRADGRVYRRRGGGAWQRVLRGWPDPPGTIAPLLIPGSRAGEFWAADERGIHWSGDGGRRWQLVAPHPEPPSHLRGLAATLVEVQARGRAPR